MNPKYLKVEISAETKKDADEILNSLLDKKLVTGGQFIQAPARFLWKGKIQDMDYFTVTSYTLNKHKDAIIADVKMTTIEEFPMITFTPFDANDELLRWIEKTVV
ncbi:MAG: divalent cation tolerance protein CutA [Candidatus Levyibacteriota bacterium]